MWHPASPWSITESGRFLPEPWARSLSRQLRRLAAALLRLARRLAISSAAQRHPAPHPGDLPRIEYHAEAGAPEGALYVDGLYVGRLEVARL